MKNWINIAQDLLYDSLKPVPHELNQLDWKINISPKDNRVTEHLIAMSNLNGGGFFVFGLNDNGKVKGLLKKDIDTIIHKITDLSFHGISPRVTIDHHIEQRDNKNILFIYVKESSKKPVCLKGKGYEYTFIRSGASTRKADDTEIGHLLLNSKIITYEEREIEKYDNIKELLEKIDYEIFFVLLEKPMPTDEEKIIEELVKYKIVVKNDSSYSLTNLGVLTIAKDMSEFTEHINRPVRLIKYVDNTNITSVKDIVGKKGYAAGFDLLIKYINNLLPHHEEIKTALREIRPLYPENLLREIIANALLHQDLTKNINPRIEIFANRIEITNAGKLPDGLSIDRMIDNIVTRNSLLVKTMFLLRICESRGSGIDRSLNAIELYGLPALEFIEGETYFKVIIYAPKEYKSMTKEERVNACYQHCALRYVSQNFMTSSSLRDRFKISNSNRMTSYRIIQDAIKLNKIKKGSDARSNSLKDIYYIPYWA